MTILRVHKKETNFLVLDKTCLTQKNLSWGAKGLHAYLMSLPPDWRANVHDLQKRAINGRDSVRGLLSELEKAGYIVKEQIRDEVTGKYRCLEYVIHEQPQAEPVESPGPENPSLVHPEPESPETGFQAPDNPGPANPSLININNNKHTENKILKAAASNEAVEAFDENETAAAAFSEQKIQLAQNTPAKVSFIHQASREDSVIGAALTPHQHERVASLVQTVSNQGFCVVADEIEYCLLNPQNFKGSGQDFGRKLNAIRTVILRGEWQTPVWLVLEEKMQAEMAISCRNSALSCVQADIHHFQRLLESAKGGARESILAVLHQSKQKMHALETTSCEAR